MTPLTVDGEMIDPRVSVPTRRRPARRRWRSPDRPTIRSIRCAAGWDRRAATGSSSARGTSWSPCASAPIDSFASRTAPASVSRVDDRRVVVEDLVLVRPGAPRRRDALGREQILRAPRDAVQRPVVAAGLDLAIRGGRLLEREILGERDDAVELRAVLLQARQIHPGEIGGADVARLDERRERRNRLEREIVERRAASRGRRQRHLDRRARALPRASACARAGTAGNRGASRHRPGCPRAAAPRTSRRLPLTPLTIAFSSASVKSTPKIFSAQSSVAASIGDGWSWRASTGAAIAAATAAGTARRNRRRAS